MLKRTMRPLVNERTFLLAGVMFLPPFVNLFFRTISQKPTQLGSPNSTYKCFTIRSEDPFIFWGETVKGQGHNTKINVCVGFCTPVSAGF